MIQCGAAAHGDVLARAGWISAIFWVLGDGLAVRFPDLGQQRGSSTIGHFSATHSITGGEA